MSCNNLGIVYDRTTGQILRIIVPDNDSQLNSVSYHSSASDEGFAQLTRAQAPTLDAVQAVINVVAGVSPDVSISAASEDEASK